MKQVYSDIQYVKQQHIAGICKAAITPREWLQTDPVIDYSTGRVLDTPILKSGRFWMALDLTPKSYNFLENQKTSKSGNYYETSLSGLINEYHYALQQVMQTLRWSQFVALCTDRNNRRRLVGTTANALNLQTVHEQKNAGGGIESVQLNFSMDAEDPAPFYNPDNFPDPIGNFLVDANGNYLLVQ